VHSLIIVIVLEMLLLHGHAAIFNPKLLWDNGCMNFTDQCSIRRGQDDCVQ